MGKIAGVNTASLGKYLHSLKTRASWAEGFHDEGNNGHVFDLDRTGSVRLYLARDLPYDANQQPYHTGSVAIRDNKDRAFCCTPGRRCQACYLCIIENSWKRQHHHWHTCLMLACCKDIKSCMETLGNNSKFSGRDGTSLDSVE